jgi:hypothetical protein
MVCYQCSKAGLREEAVATCRSCHAGLCQSHLRETAEYLATGAIRTACPHDTWAAVPAGDPACPQPGGHSEPSTAHCGQRGRCESKPTR